MNIPICELKPGREKSVLGKHPWVFSGAVAREPEAASGDTVDVYSRDGVFLARGAYNPHSQIRVRIFSFEAEPIDAEFFYRRLHEANAWRQPMLPHDTNCYRVCFSEGDFLPGLIVDNYDECVVLQILTAGAELNRNPIIEAVRRVLRPKLIYERSDSGFRLDEGLEKRSGPIEGGPPPELVEVKERGLRFLVDLAAGQKTGMYLDQRDSRRLVERITQGKSVLNTFSYTCSFAIPALVGGATRVVNVDVSAPALQIGRRNYELNELPFSDEHFVCEDAFDYLRGGGEKFDLIILDPPAFSKSKASVPQALRGYKEIIMQGLKRLTPGGYLMVFSCSGHVDSALFQKVIFGAALDVRSDVQVVARLGHPFDHPVNIYHPEGEYLCGYLVHAAQTRAHA